MIPDAEGFPQLGYFFGSTHKRDSGILGISLVVPLFLETSII